MRRLLLVVLSVGLFLGVQGGPISASHPIPLPEHPRPDFHRHEWLNLNGLWNFTFNAQTGEKSLQSGTLGEYDRQIMVPFPWGAPLSQVANEGNVGWYGRQVTVPEQWRGKRIFLVVGASEWQTKAWVNGNSLGEHRGGYTPFEFELTPHITYGQPQTLVISADDSPSSARLGGKQGYGDARGIWQTVYLEARGERYVDYVHFAPDVDRSLVQVSVALDRATPGSEIHLSFLGGEQSDVVYKVGRKAGSVVTFDVPLTKARLWSLEDPYLYDMQVSLMEGGDTVDCVQSYFGHRKIGVGNLPGTEYPYVTINDRPVYLQLCLDQSYHPEGFYTFPSDEFMRNEILLSKRLGLNGNRIHIKAEVPRKLYWADKLGLLIMADVPNWWGEPTDAAKADWAHCRDAQIRRDYNHPSIFSWICFNETWGLFTKQADASKKYEPATQEWVRQEWAGTKKLDPTRLVEDNSPCNNDHVESDLNTFHGYFPGYDWNSVIRNAVDSTRVGGMWNYINGNRQNGVPMFNSECGNVWGYKGSTGDVDFTWDYHRMINAFRSHPLCAGWLYTEHHDVINEWNGYVRYDRSPKIDGMSDLVPGMTMADFHAPYYIAPQGELCCEVESGSRVEVPLFASFMTDRDPGRLTLRSTLVGCDQLGVEVRGTMQTQEVAFAPYRNEMIDPVSVEIPAAAGLYRLQLELENSAGVVLHRNFVAFVAKGTEPKRPSTQWVSVSPGAFTASQWSVKQWSVLDARKVNGTGTGYFEYTLPWPEKCEASDLESITLVCELSAKKMFAKDITGQVSAPNDYDYMLGEGQHDPCKNPNSYAMTGNKPYPTFVRISVNGTAIGEASLPDDPADHRGILSWHAQPRDRTLSEAGSYGYLVKVSVPLSCVVVGQPITLRLEVPKGIQGGLAIYGKEFGRYPVDPTLVFIRK